MPSESGAFVCRHVVTGGTQYTGRTATQYMPRPRPCHPNPVRLSVVTSRRTQYMPRRRPCHLNPVRTDVCRRESLHTVYAYAHAIMRARLARVLIHVMSLLHLPEMAPTQIQYSEPHTEPPHHDGNGVP
jgi:hypothetical protein